MPWIFLLFFDHFLSFFPAGIGRSVCDSIVVEGVPLIIETLEKEEDVNTVCVGMQFCKTPLPSNHSDPIPLSTVTLDLDDPPEQRWTTLCNNASAISFWNGVVSVLKQVLSLGHGNGTEVLKLGHALNARMQPDYGAEVRSCAAGLGLDYGWVTLFQLGYKSAMLVLQLLQRRRMVRSIMQEISILELVWPSQMA